MPSAITGQEFMGDYQFTTTASPTEISAYYTQELAKLGWELHTDMMSPGFADLVFSKAGLYVFFLFVPDGNNITVKMHLAQQ
jgi:hypothetical protein